MDIFFGICVIILIACHKTTARIFKSDKIPELDLKITNLKSELDTITRDYTARLNTALVKIETETDLIQKLQTENKRLAGQIIGLQKKIRRLQK